MKSRLRPLHRYLDQSSYLKVVRRSKNSNLACICSKNGGAMPFPILRKWYSQFPEFVKIPPSKVDRVRVLHTPHSARVGGTQSGILANIPHQVQQDLGRFSSDAIQRCEAQCALNPIGRPIAIPLKSLSNHPANPINA